MNDVVKEYVLGPGMDGYANTRICDCVNARKRVVAELLREYAAYTKDIRDISDEYATNVTKYNLLTDMCVDAKNARDFNNLKDHSANRKNVAIYLKDLKMMIKSLQRAQCKVQCILNTITDPGLMGCTLVITKNQKLLVSCDEKSNYGYIPNFDVTVYD